MDVSRSLNFNLIIIKLKMQLNGPSGSFMLNLTNRANLNPGFPVKKIIPPKSQVFTFSDVNFLVCPMVIYKTCAC